MQLMYLLILMLTYFLVFYIINYRYTVKKPFLLRLSFIEVRFRNIRYFTFCFWSLFFNFFIFFINKVIDLLNIKSSKPHRKGIHALPRKSSFAMIYQVKYLGMQNGPIVRPQAKKSPLPQVSLIYPHKNILGK